jgi:hypothetical protein
MNLFSLIFPLKENASPQTQISAGSYKFRFPVVNDRAKIASAGLLTPSDIAHEFYTVVDSLRQ